MSPIFITEDDVGQLLSMKEAVKAVEQAMLARAAGKIWNNPRSRLPIPGGSYNFMAASWPEKNVVGHKSYTAGRFGASFHVMLYGCSGEGLLAVIEANRAGQIRTGAASGVATKYLSKDISQSVLGIIGTGYQAETQVEAIFEVRNITQVNVFSRDKKNRDAFVAKMSPNFGDMFVAVNSAEEVSESADIITAITNSKTPVITHEMISTGVHINAAGNNSWLKNEVDTDTVCKSDVVVTDDIDQSKIECGELMKACETGKFSWDKVIQLDSIVSRKILGRTSDTDVTLFESQGVALEDLAVCDLIYNKAVKRGIGLGI